MAEAGTTYVQVMKMDIELSEYDVLPQTLALYGHKPPFCQLLLELHNNSWPISRPTFRQRKPSMLQLERCR